MTTCGICHNTINKDKSVLTSCNHRFCTSCFFTWMKEKTNCPYCRTAFGPPIGVEERLQLQQLIEQTHSWESYQSELNNNIVHLENKLNESYGKVADQELEMKNLNSKIIYAKEQLVNIIEECKQRKQEILQQEAIMKRKRDTMAAYMREWQILHSKKQVFKMRF